MEKKQYPDRNSGTQLNVAEEASRKRDTIELIRDFWDASWSTFERPQWRRTFEPYGLYGKNGNSDLAQTE